MAVSSPLPKHRQKKLGWRMVIVMNLLFRAINTCFRKRWRCYTQITIPTRMCTTGNLNSKSVAGRKFIGSWPEANRYFMTLAHFFRRPSQSYKAISHIERTVVCGHITEPHEEIRRGCAGGHIEMYFWGSHDRKRVCEAFASIGEYVRACFNRPVILLPCARGENWSSDRWGRLSWIVGVSIK